MEVKRIKAGSNCYVVSQGDNAIIVDCGVSGNEEKIIKACEGKKITLILLTHGHLDHIQNAKLLSERLHVPVAMSKKDLRLLEEPKSAIMKSEGFLNGLVAFFSKISTKYSKPVQIQPDIYLKEGDSLVQYGIDGTVVELPGHTAGSIGIKTKEFLIAGDAMFAMFKPGIAALYEDKEAMLRSVAKIQSMGKCKIFVGHGNPMDNGTWIS